MPPEDALGQAAAAPPGHTLEYVVIGLYLVFMLLTGLAFRRFISNFSDYFRSGCRATWWMVGASVFMTSFSAWTFTAAAGVAYSSGISVAIIFLANFIGYVVNVAWTAPWFRQLRAITFPEVIRERFGTVTQQAYVLLGTLPMLLTAAVVLVAVAVFTSAVFGFDKNIVIIVLGVVILLYSTIGGSWSVFATDFLQTLILMPVAVLVAVLSLMAIGGPANLVAEIHAQGVPQMLELIDNSGATPYSGWFAMAMILFVMLTYNSMSASVKYFACKDGREARKAAALAAVLMLIGAALWFIPPIVARLMFADLVAAQQIPNPGEASYAVIAMQLLPAGFTGLIVVAMFTATMSSLDSILNHFAAIVTQDVYKPFVRRGATDRELFLVGQACSFITGVAIVMLALFFANTEGLGLFDYMLLIGGLFGTPMVVPMFMALFVRRVPWWSALASIGAGFAISITAFVSGRMGYPWSYPQQIFSIVAASASTYLLTIPFARHATSDYRARVAAFYAKMHRPVDFEREVGNASDAAQLNLVGGVTTTIGAFIGLLALLPNPLAGRVQILAVAGAIVFFGVMMHVAAWRRKRRTAREASSLALPESAEPAIEEPETVGAAK